jgi:hypothetical protein
VGGRSATRTAPLRLALRMGCRERWREDPPISGAGAVAVADLAAGGADAVGGRAMGKVFITGRRPLKYRNSNIGEAGNVFITGLLYTIL